MIEKDIMRVAGYPYLTESTFQSLQNILGDMIYIRSIRLQSLKRL